MRSDHKILENTMERKKKRRIFFRENISINIKLKLSTKNTDAYLRVG